MLDFSKPSKKPEDASYRLSPACLLLLWFLFAWLIFDFEDMFLQNVNCLLPDYTALHPKRQNSPLMPLWELQILKWKIFLSIKECPWLVYQFWQRKMYFDNFGYPKRSAKSTRLYSNFIHKADLSDSCI